METAFYAMLYRLKHIMRWGLMRNQVKENVMEHSYQVAVISHALYTIRQKFFSEGRMDIDLSELLRMALYHDASEIITGDMPTPIKYQTKELRDAYAMVENDAADRLLRLLPENMRADYADYLGAFQSENTKMDEARLMQLEETHKIMKAADTLCAYIKCIEEERLGNPEFSDALISTEKKLKEFELPELEYFIEKFIPAFSKSLDELQK